MPIKAERQYRAVELRSVQREETEEPSYKVEGYAANFEKYVLFEDSNGNKTFEQFDRKCFDKTDMSDVIFLYNHEGRVLAAMRNGSLKVSIDDNGLKVAADLSGSDEARAIWNDINNGLVAKMSWAFAPGEYDYKVKERTIYHRTVKKIYDVSAVSIPANDTTTIGTRSWADGVIQPIEEEFLKREREVEKLKLKLKLEGVLNE